MSESPEHVAPQPAVEAVEWLAAASGGGLVRVRGRDPLPDGPPALSVRAGGREVVVESLPDARFGRDPSAWRGTYVLPEGVEPATAAAATLRWPGGRRVAIRLPAALAATPARPWPAEFAAADGVATAAAGAGVVDAGALAARRARRARAGGTRPAERDEAPPDEAARAWAEHRAELEAALARVREDLARAREEGAARAARLEAELATAEARLRAESVARAALEDELDRTRTARSALATALGASRGAHAAERSAAELLRGELDAERVAAAVLRRGERELRHAAAAAEKRAAAAEARAGAADERLADVEADLAAAREALLEARARAEDARRARSAAEAALSAAAATAAARDAAPEPATARAPAVPPDARNPGGSAFLERVAPVERAARAGADLGPPARALADGDLGAGARALAGGDLGAGARALAGGDLGARARALAGAGRARPDLVADLEAAASALRAPRIPLRDVLVRLACADAGGAARLLAQLLPALPAIFGGDFDVTVRGAGTFAVSPTGVERLARPRSRRRARFHLEGTPRALAGRLTGEDGPFGRFRGDPRVRGSHAAARDALRTLAAADLTLAGLVRAGARPEPRELLAALPHAIPPEWTAGHAFTVAHQVAGRTWWVSAADGAGVRVGRDAPPPTATVVLSRAAFDALVRGEPAPPGERPAVRGDRDAVAQLKRWIDAALGSA